MNRDSIAIIGMAGRFPGACNPAEFWQNLSDGVEAVRRLSEAELLAAGVSADELAQPEYVKSGAVLENLEMFDAAFFGFNPKEAAIMDPQHRIFLECAWEALENAGHVPGNAEELTAVFAGSGMNTYMIHNLLTNPQLVASSGLFLIRQTGNDKDVLATRVSYELDLHGPSINVQTACSTSLVAVHLACQSLLNQECDLALAGGVTVEFPHGRGYLYREGEILSRDGHCRAFDADSSGTVFSSGAGIVVLRRLDDALAARDTIHAVILGSAVNNDGARKVGYFAPSVDGQVEVITEALGVAGATPDEISYVETHGTGTKVGDPIEIKALTQAFRQNTASKGYCAIGSLKTNIGHLDTAAGVAGLIKTAQALQHRQIPPSLHFQKPNPLIDFENSPFYVNTVLTEWKAKRGPRRAGVTSLGIGGTNAHVVLEEAPLIEQVAGVQERQRLLVLSAKTASALDQASKNLSRYLQAHPELPLQDVAYTLQLGRKAFAHRSTTVAASTEEAARALAKPVSSRILKSIATAPDIVFLFSGQGSQHVDMGRELYESEAVFRNQMDHCAEVLIPFLGLDLRALLFPPESDSAAAAEKLSQTAFTQPALFSLEYSLAQWWMTLGIAPSAMIGHSIGEYVAACLAGVFTLEDGLRLTALRGLLMGDMQPGSMLSVAAAADAVAIPGDIAIAAINGPSLFVASGATDAIQRFAQKLEKRGISSRLLHTSHAFHSTMMDPVLEPFREHLAGVPLHAPKIPFLSNVSGTWITHAEATDPGYWTKHLRETVRFSAGLTELFRSSSRVFLEVGPGQALTSLTRQHPERPKDFKVLPSMRHPQEQASDTAFLLSTVGQLWSAGLPIDWNALHAGEEPRRIPLPTYPFERQRHWIEAGVNAPVSKPANTIPDADAPKDQPFFHRRVWTKSPAEKAVPSQRECWLVFLDETGLGSEIARQLRTGGYEILEVAAGGHYTRSRSGSYAIRPGMRSDYDQLLKDIAKHGQLPTQILHLWPIASSNSEWSLDQTLDRTFYSLLFLMQAWGERDMGPVAIQCVSNGLQSVSGEEVVEAARATLLGPVRVIPKEFPGVFCRNIDLDRNIPDTHKAASYIIAESSLRGADSCVAYRQSERWVEGFEAVNLSRGPGSRLREKGVYLITGGLGGIGLTIAEYLARTVQARLVLVGRAPLPPATEWERALQDLNTPNSTRKKITQLRKVEALGSEVLTLSADVADPSKIADALRDARRHFGCINGVIHAAGLIEDGPLQIKTRESAARVLASKVQGTLALQQALKGNELDFFLLFSSVSSLAPPAGQVDYAAANAFLDAFALGQVGRQLKTTAVNWGLWDDVGLASREGAVGSPLLDRRLAKTATETIHSKTLSFEKDWILSEHRFKNGVALIPGTGYLQLAAAAMLEERFAAGIEFENVLFLAPLTVAPGETREIRVRLFRQGSTFRFSIMAKRKNWAEYACGQIARNHRSIPADQDVSEIRARCSLSRRDFNETKRTRQEQYFDFGPRWRNLRSLYIGEREALAEVQLAKDFLGDIESWPMHPALLDLATASALYVIPAYEESDALYLPLSYKQVTFFRPLPTKFYSHIRCTQENTSQREIVTFSFTLLDGAGQVLAEINEFALRRMASTVDGPTLVLPSAESVAQSGALEMLASQGMSAEAAIEALDQILSSDVSPQFIVKRGDFPERLPEQMSAPRPTNPATPTRDVESALAEWWQELLGVEHVNQDDDFFELGGHSLTGVRLFAKIEKTYQVRLDLANLFKARTVRQLAELIRKFKTPDGAESTSWSALVPIQPNGSRPPLFCVHALGPSVLFYRQLAELLGPDQPFYALQSPLASGAKKRETSIEELASIYTKELLSLFPDGPYKLGGSSLGGLIAFEMAQVLHAQGKAPELLLLFDASVPGCDKTVPLRGQIRGHWQNFRKFGAIYLLQRTRSKGEYWLSRLSRLVRARALFTLRLYYERGTRAFPSSWRNFQTEEAHRRALKHYVPRFYPGPITLIRAAETPETVGTHKDLTLGWKNLAGGGLQIYDVPGDHLSMFEEPNVRVLAETLKAVLPSRELSVEKWT